jgi:hypothetical protein
MQEGEMVDLKAVDSSMIAAAGYDAETGTLVVLFNTGQAYEYYGVPQETYDGLLAAESKGRYMNANIIDVYSYSQFKGWKGKDD